MSRRLRTSLPMLAAATVLCVMAAGQAHPAGRAVAGSAAQACSGGTLRLGGLLVPPVDPAIAYLPGAWQIEYATCAKLFNYPDAAGAVGARLVPEVVDRFTVSKDGRTYTFTLKRTFRFHTGAPVTAQSFAYAFNRDANPTLNSGATAYMREIVGAAAVMDGTAQSISGVRVLGRYRLQIRLTRPVGE